MRSEVEDSRCGEAFGAFGLGWAGQPARDTAVCGRDHLGCRRHHITKVDILGFEFEMGLFRDCPVEEARGKGIDLAPKYIPADIFDKRAVEKRQVVFHDAAYVEVKPHLTPAKKGNPATLALELTDFSVFYSQDSVIQAEEELAKKRKAAEASRSSSSTGRS